MCELLGMSANVPTDICFSFAGLAERGGRTGPHKDGWGVTFYEGKGCRSFLDPGASADSAIAAWLKQYPIKSKAVICHIRQANSGRISLENTHPFSRALWGKYWTFAHNGQVPAVKGWSLGDYQPVGTTDSEYAFCWLLSQLRERFGSRSPGALKSFRYIQRLAPRLHALGVFNFLLTDGSYLLAFCSNNLHWITRRAPFGKARLLDQDMEVDFQQHTTPDDVVTVIATRPLTCNEQWHAMQAGETALFRLGERLL